MFHILYLRPCRLQLPAILLFRRNKITVNFLLLFPMRALDLLIKLSVASWNKLLPDLNQCSYYVGGSVFLPTRSASGHGVPALIKDTLKKEKHLKATHPLRQQLFIELSSIVRAVAFPMITSLRMDESCVEGPRITGGYTGYFWTLDQYGNDDFPTETRRVSSATSRPIATKCKLYG